jgi:hypothetical protein
MRASGSSIPSNFPMGRPNCLRTAACALATRRRNLIPPVAVAGSEMPRPAARLSISIRQPFPAPADPPMTVVLEREDHVVPSVGQL